MLEMRRLTEENLGQSLELSQYAFQFRIPGEKIEQRKNLLRWQEIWGEFDGEQLVSKLHILPMEVYVGGRVFSMGGLAGVATWPEQRRRGSVTRLLKHALQSMKAQTIQWHVKKIGALVAGICESVQLSGCDLQGRHGRS
jgi:predicted acetyltransferase